MLDGSRVVVGRRVSRRVVRIAFTSARPAGQASFDPLRPHATNIPSPSRAPLTAHASLSHVMLLLSVEQRVASGVPLAWHYARTA